MTTTTSEVPLTLKSVQKHIVLTIVGCLILAIGTAFVTSVGFYYKTNNDVNNLTVATTENTQGIKDLNTTIDKLADKVTDGQTPTSINSLEVRNLKERMDKFDVKLDAIYNLLLDIKK